MGSEATRQERGRWGVRPLGRREGDGEGHQPLASKGERDQGMECEGELRTYKHNFTRTTETHHNCLHMYVEYFVMQHAVLYICTRSTLLPSSPLCQPPPEWITAGLSLYQFLPQLSLRYDGVLLLADQLSLAQRLGIKKR